MSSAQDTFLRIEKWFTVAALLFFSEGIFRLVLTGGSNQGDGTQYDASIVQLIALLIYGVTAGLLLLRWKKVLMFLSRDRWILPLIAIVVASTLWSSAPDLTFRRSIALVGTSLFGTYLATRYSIRQQLNLLGWMFGFAIILSVLFVVAIPEYGIAGGVHEGAWRGIWSHKNGLGQKMAIAVNVFWLLSLSMRQKRWLAWMGLIFSMLLVIMARSTAGLLAAIVPMALIPLAQSFRWRYQFAIPAAIALLAASGLAAIGISVGAETILTALGEDATLTGRTEFWPIIIEMIRRQPWLGYGYSAFWMGLDGPSAQIVHATPGHTPSHAHNGLLQLWLHLGFLGVTVFLIGFWNTILKSLAWIRLSDSAAGFWPLVYCAMMIQFNISESVILEYNQLPWVIYVAVALSVLQLPQRSTAEPPREQQLTPATVQQ